MGSGLGVVFDGVYSASTLAYKRQWSVPPSYQLFDALFGFRESGDTNNVAGSTSEAALAKWVIVNQTACTSAQGDHGCLVNGPIIAECTHGCPSQSKSGTIRM